jgi:hypothetical protein
MRLIERSGTSGWYALSMADDRKSALELRRRFEALPSVGRVVEVASLIPENQPAKVPIIRNIHQTLTKLPAKTELPVLSPPRTEAILEQIHELSKLPLPEESTARALLTRLQDQAKPAALAIERTASADRARRLGRYERRWVEDLLDQLQELRSASNPNPVTKADLPPVLAERYLSPNGKWLLQVFAKNSVWDVQPLSEFCKQVASVDPNATGKPISTLWSLTQMKDGYIHSAYYSAVIILLMVWLDFRSIRDTLLASIPLAMGFIITCGIMGLMGMPFNPANMIALPLILGIGIDAGVHVVHDFRSAKGRYTLPWRLTRALLLVGSTTVVGFASLLTAHHQGIISTGIVLSIGVTTCCLSAVLVLPAVLQLVARGSAVVAVEMPQPAAYRKSA